MEWKLRIKTGIFKSQEYLLKIEKGGIILIPQTAGMKRLKFSERQINSISIIKKNTGAFEVELNTQQGIYYGVLLKEADISQVFKALSETFGNRVSVI